MIHFKRPSFPVAALVLAIFTSTPSHAAIECSVPMGSSTSCTCHGDAECNEMFSKYCKEGGGRCDSGTGICTCAAKAPTPTTGAPPKTGNPVAAPILNLSLIHI